jgi:flagellar hook-length control protein FliK
MLSSGMDNLTRAPCEAWSAPVEPGFAPPGPQAGAAPSFGDYLRQAQSQPSQTQQEAADSAPSAASSSSVQEQPDPEDTRESAPSPTAADGNDAASPPQAEDASTGQQDGLPGTMRSRVATPAGSAPGRAADEQATQEGPAGSPHQSPDGQDRGETTAGEPRPCCARRPAGPEHHDKNSGEAAVVLDLNGVAAAALQPLPAPVDNAKNAAAALPVEPSAAAAAAARAGVTPSGMSGDGTATALAGLSGHALVAATSAGLPAGQPAQPAAEQAAAPCGDASCKSGGADEKAAAVAEAHLAAAAVGQSASGAAAEPPLPTVAAMTAPDSSAAWATSRLGADGEASGEAARLQATQAAAIAAPPAVAMAATWSGHGNRASKAGEAAGAGDAIGPTSTPSGAAAATPSAGGQSSASQASAAATQGPQTADPAPVDRARFVQRVEQAVQSMGDQAGSLRLRLSPPELGSLRITLSVRQGELNARLEVETSSARNLLLDHLGELRDRLAQQNIKIQQFDVDVADRRPGGMGGQAGQFEQYSQSHTGQGGGRWAAPASQSGDVPSPADSAAPQPLGGSQLNVVV